MGDVLVFLTVEEEIEDACRRINREGKSITGKGELLAIPLYSSLPPHLRDRVFEPAPVSSTGVKGRKVGKDHSRAKRVNYIKKKEFYSRAERVNDIKKKKKKKSKPIF